MLIVILLAFAAIIATMALSEFLARARRQPVICRSGAFSEAITSRGPTIQSLLRPTIPRSFHKETSTAERLLEGPEALVDVAVIGDSALFLGETIAGWHSVSSEVLQAVAHLTHTDVSSFLDLFTVVHEEGYNLASPHFFYLLRGHIGEWETIKHFAAFAPSMPISPTQPGYDMQFGEHGLANVKVVGDARQAIATHATSHPDVSVIINGDAAHIPAHALNFNPGEHFDPSVFSDGHTVVVDHLLTAAHTGAEAHNAIHHLQHPVGLHFPWISMVVAGIVEGGLVVKGKTTFGRALKNTATTTSGVGAGSLLGHMGGGAAGGMAFGPPGIVIGAVVGTIFGAVGGRFAAKRINLRPLRDAEAAAYSAKADLEGQAERLTCDADIEWKTAIEVENELLTHELRALSDGVDDTLCRIAVADSQRLQAVSLRMKQRVEDARLTLLSRIRLLEVWSALNPWARSRLLALRYEAANWRREVEAAESDISQLGDLLVAVPGSRKLIAGLIDDLLSVRAQFFIEVERCSASTLSASIDKRFAAARNLESRWKALELKIQSALDAPTNVLKAAIVTFNSEREAAGLS